MLISKHKESKIQKDYFFVKGNIPNINVNYFVNKIEDGIKQEESLNGKTNVKGFMTSYKYFNHDIELYKILNNFMDYYEQNKFSDSSYTLWESWGIKETFGNYTCEHNHRHNFWSGVIYLSNVDQPLIFTEIEEEVESKIGNFCIFSSFLNHKTKNRVFMNDVKYAVAFNFNEV